ncbi:NUDIX hydrolase [Planctomycetota bacterium]
MANSNLIQTTNTNSLAKGVKVAQQSCAVPFRKKDGQIEFCLITSRKKRQWIFPKGIIEPGETPHHTALKEAMEEAGLSGSVVGAPLGKYQYTKNKKLHAVTVFMMEVARCEKAWQESNHRIRRWASPHVARRMLSKIELADLLDAAVQRKSEAVVSS